MPGKARLRYVARCGLLLLGLLCMGLTAAADDEQPWQPADPQPGAEAAPPEDADASPEPGPTAESGDYPLCVVTGERWDTSSTRVEAIFRVDGERLRGKFLSLLYMLIQYKLLQEEGHDVHIETISVVDFATFGSGTERMIAVDEEWGNIVFVASEAPLAGSKEPYYAAFSVVEDVERFQKTLGGKVQNLNSVMKRLLQALNSGEDDDAVVESIEESMRRVQRHDPLA